MNDTAQDRGPGIAMLRVRMIQAAGVFAGVAITSWVFLYLFGVSMTHDHAEKLTAIIPAAGLVAFLLGLKRHAAPNSRWALLEFFAASLVSYLILQFVVVDLI